MTDLLSDAHSGSLRATPAAERHGSLLIIALLALLVGAASGIVGAVFRLGIEWADRLREALLTWAHQYAVLGLLYIVAGCAATTLIAALIVRRFSPHASGSGIPHVEAVLREELPPPPSALVVVVVKFAGGILAIGSGLALGREGPSVQMGAVIASWVGRVFSRSWPDCRVLIAAGAGAGLATAFNAPIAGAIFVLEELVQKFESRIAIAALAASATAIAIARVLLGDAPDFQVGPLGYVAEARPLFFLFGIVAGLLAIAYNATLIAVIGTAERLTLSVETRAATIGAAVGLLAWFAPTLVGGGDAITQQALAGTGALGLVPFAFLLRFGLGAVSYAAATPGGLFAPLLVLGAQSGLLFGAACRWIFPGLDIQPEAFALVGMPAFFTGVVRAPLTGIVLATEMTGNTTMLLPMLGACFTAMLVPMLLRNPPIYDSLREQTVRREQIRQQQIKGHRRA
jgi:CIC family chloride channel protein